MQHDKQQTFQFNREILKACDIRGEYGKELTAESGYHIGRAFGTILERKGLKNCAVGYDGRHSSPELSEQIIQGLVESGIDVLLAGLVPTPIVYHVVQFQPADAGLIITASHNPSQDNGCKFLLHDSLFHGDDILELARISEQGEYHNPEFPGSVTELDAIGPYIHYLTSELPSRDFHAVWDPGNGAAAALIHDVVNTLPGEHTVICGTVDGDFPNHHPDPCKPENMRMLSATVRAENADLGIGFDGDGDRIGVVDSQGRLLTGDQLMVIYARDYLATHPGATVMSEVKAGTFFYQDVANQGGIPLMWKVGHANQKEKMRTEGIGLAGETSGHIFFDDNFGYDDGLFAAMKLLKILSHQNQSLAEILDTFPTVYSSGEVRLGLPTKERLQLVDDIRNRLLQEKYDVVTLDGVRVNHPDGYWILRGSNTQPHITTYCEAETPEALEKYKKEMAGLVADAGYSFDELVICE